MFVMKLPGRKYLNNITKTYNKTMLKQAKFATAFTKKWIFKPLFTKIIRD